jgi:dethiobiotin synthetase
MTAIFIAGAHTDVGKTHVACGLLAAARDRGLSVAAFKPVMSGFDPDRAEQSDAGRLLAAMGRPLSDLDQVSPWRFAEPVAPPLAAAKEGVLLDRAPITAAAAGWLARQDADLALVEGAGGVMSPLAEDGLNLDLMADLGLPVVLVGGRYLGAISHTLSALEVVRGRQLDVLAVVISRHPAPDAPDFADTLGRVRAFSTAPVFPFENEEMDRNRLLDRLTHR